MKKILVPFDDNVRSAGALEFAAMFANGIGAQIIALHLANPKDYHSKSEFQKDLYEMADEQLRPLLRKIQKTYPDVRKIGLEIRGMRKHLHEHILEFAEENEIDFIILRSHGLPDGDWEIYIKKTSAYKVVLEAKCPVFTFTAIPEDPKLKNILVPIDLSEGSLYKVPLAITLAQQFNATIHLISGSEQREDNEELEVQLKEISAEIRKRKVKVCSSSVYFGNLPEVIESYVSQTDVDLIMIMNRPGFRWRDLWVSPKAKRIISLSKIPVISMRSNEPVDVDI